MRYHVISESVEHYLTHIGKLTSKLDYENKKVILSKLCSGEELQEAIRCLNMFWRRTSRSY